MELLLYEAIKASNVSKAKEILRDTPNLKVNWVNHAEYGTPFLSVACDKGLDSVVSILLAHPDINVNLKTKYGWTPLYVACLREHTSPVRLMLKDSRVKVNEPDKDGSPPLWNAAYYGYLDTIKWWIASGRGMDLGKPGDVGKTDVIGVAMLKGNPKVVTLLERFKSDATQTRHAMRLKLGWYDEAAAEMFALVVFVSDGLLQIKDTTPSPAARFFKIAKRIPLELQMILCHRQVGSGKEIIPGKDSEVAFKELAKRLW